MRGLGMGATVVLGQDLGAVAGPVRDGAVADLAARDRRWVTVTGKRRDLGLLIGSGDAGPVAVTLPCAARTPHGTGEGSWPAGRANSG